jgi:hypothetical protein
MIYVNMSELHYFWPNLEDKIRIYVLKLPIPYKITSLGLETEKFITISILIN